MGRASTTTQGEKALSFWDAFRSSCRGWNGWNGSQHWCRHPARTRCCTTECWHPVQPGERRSCPSPSAVAGQTTSTPGRSSDPSVRAEARAGCSGAPCSSGCSRWMGSSVRCVISPCAYKRWYFRRRRCRCSMVSSWHAGDRPSAWHPLRPVHPARTLTPNLTQPIWPRLSGTATTRRPHPPPPKPHPQILCRSVVQVFDRR